MRSKHSGKAFPCFLLLPLTMTMLAAGSMPALAQRSGITDEEKAKMIAELSSLRDRSKSQAMAGLQNAKKTLEQALSSETQFVQLYTDSVRATEFAGLSNSAEMLREWKKKNDAAISARESRAAIRRHIEYLILTIKAMGEVPKDGLMEELLNYAAGLDREQALDRSNALLAKPIAASPIARNLGISAPKSEWIAEAGNTRAMFEKLLLPWMREKKDPRLLDYWKGRIAAESEAAAAERIEFRSGLFERVEKPRLLWAQAKDAALLGHEAAALREMISILRANPGHSDFESWAAEFEKLITLSAPAAPDPQPEP